MLAFFSIGVISIFIISNSHAEEIVSKSTSLVADVIKSDTKEEIKKRKIDDALVFTKSGEILMGSSKIFKSEDYDPISKDINKIYRKYSILDVNNRYVYTRSVKVKDDIVYVQAEYVPDIIKQYITWSVTSIMSLLLILLITSIAIGIRVSDTINGTLDQVTISLQNLLDGNTVSIIKPNRFYKELNPIVSNIDDLAADINLILYTLRTEKKKISYIIENISDGILALDNDKKIVLANSKIRNMLRLEEDTAICGMKEILESETNFANLLYHLISNNKNDSKKISILNKTYEIVLVVLEEQIDIKYIISVYDITDTENTISQRATFFQNASHELKTPLTCITGISEIMMCKAEKGSKEYKDSKLIYDESIKLNKLVEGMLNINELEYNSQIVLHHEYFYLSEVVNSIIKSFTPVLKTDNKKIVFNGDGRVYNDKKYVYLIFENLISNAIKYTNENGLITINIIDRIQDIRVSIEDNGIGISKEDKNYIFDRFYKVDKARTRKLGGSGLGLSIVKHACNLCNINIKINSTLKIGTTVYLTIKRDIEEFNE